MLQPDTRQDERLPVLDDVQIERAAPRSDRLQEFFKRLIDIVLSCLFIVLFAPALIFAGLAVKTDGGPVFFFHERIGKNGVRFRCIKLRTMKVGAEEMLEWILARDPEARVQWQEEHKLRNDPRVTRVGRFLRKTSLDELPQLFNVLKGDMALVGPRPIVPEEVERYGPAIRYYLHCRPGMTGLWQVSGRNLVSYNDRVMLDADYGQQISVWKDCTILAKTVLIVFSQKGAF